MEKENSTLKLMDSGGMFRARDFARAGISSTKIQNARKAGEIIKLGRGLYVSSNRKSTTQDHLAEIAIKYPRSVFCLLTALQIHGITTQSPHEVWLAIDNKARKPSIDYPPLRIVRFSGPALTAGVEQKSIDGVVQIPVTSVAKTIADCFKYRHKIGLDVALEALKDACQQKKVSMDELWQAAEICRMTNVMRPYLESLI
jgi:predicted transcriptional regulator of viral defense system